MSMHPWLTEAHATAHRQEMVRVAEARAARAPREHGLWIEALLACVGGLLIKAGERLRPAEGEYRGLHHPVHHAHD